VAWGVAGVGKVKRAWEVPGKNWKGRSGTLKTKKAKGRNKLVGEHCEEPPRGTSTEKNEKHEKKNQKTQKPQQKNGSKTETRGGCRGWSQCQGNGKPGKKALFFQLSHKNGGRRGGGGRSKKRAIRVCPGKQRGAGNSGEGPSGGTNSGNVSRDEKRKKKLKNPPQYSIWSRGGKNITGKPARKNAMSSVKRGWPVLVWVRTGTV